MTNEHLEKPRLRQKLAHEFSEMAWIFLYLALFLCALATYSTLLNALIMSKVILLGEYAHLGRRLEGRPLLLTAVVKALQFALLMAVFHVIEEVIKHLFHGHTAASAVREVTRGRLTEILVRNLVVFFALVPFFTFRELQRVLGEEKFFGLFFRSGDVTAPRAVGR